VTDAAADTYPQPKDGWVCFHCGERFTTPGSARDHFGFEPSSEPGCRIKLGAERGLLMALRRAEEEAARLSILLVEECSDVAKAWHAASARHAGQLITAEEAGYERGLRDGRRLGEIGEG
jgi:hypothetical protein